MGRSSVFGRGCSVRVGAGYRENGSDGRHHGGFDLTLTASHYRLVMFLQVSFQQHRVFWHAK